MQLVFDQLKCPRDRLALRTIYNYLPLQTELCIDTDDPNAYLTLMRQQYWTRVVSFGVPKDVAFWGQHLRYLEIRTDGDVSLNVVEFLPRLEQLRVVCACLQHGFGWKQTVLKRADIITLSTMILHSEIAFMTSLETLCIEAPDLMTYTTIHFPASVKTLRCTGFLRDTILDAVSHAEGIETLALRRALMCHFPIIPPTVIDLDLAGNYIKNWDTYQNTLGVRRVSLAGNIGFCMDSLSPTGLPIEWLDLRGAGDTYPDLPEVEEIWHTHDPPSDILLKCPRIKRIQIKPAPRIPIPGHGVFALATHGSFHREDGHRPPSRHDDILDLDDDDEWDDESHSPRSTRTYSSYIDNLHILYSVPEGYARNGDDFFIASS